MADLRTTVTELVTGLGTLGFATAAEAIAARPAEMVSVSPEQWELLTRAHDGGALADAFDQAWANGVAFARARDGLRCRPPVTVEWKGSHKAPGDEVAPADLRVDHVYLISCKYLSKIVINASPSFLFDRLLRGGHGQRGGDWYAEVAPAEYQALYQTVAAELGWADLPAKACDLDQVQRKRLAGELRAGWPAAAQGDYARLAGAIATQSAARWQESLSPEGAGGRVGSALRGDAAGEAMLWRILRMGSAPYFVLGSSTSGPLRLRVATPWDWRLGFRLRSFHCFPQDGGQPRVGWAAAVEDRHSGVVRTVEGHVEVRWSHGRFGGNPEAKVYLDTPHAEVPGYFPLV